MSDKPAEPGAYDRFVDWGKRLKREGPFFADLFEAHRVRSVIDAGAGSAQHAIMFAGWGKDVAAVDPGEDMLEAARDNAAEARDRTDAAGGSLTVLAGGFGQLAALGLGPADAITCTGNALPHVAGVIGLREALADFHAVLRPGGVLVLHLLNHSRLLAARPRTIPPVVRDDEAGTTVFLRVIDYPEGGETLGFTFLTITRDAEGDWALEDRRSDHTALPLELLDSELRGAGFADVRAFGDHAGRPLDLETDESLVLTAVRGA